MDNPAQKPLQIRWRPIPGLDGFEISEKGEISVRKLLLPAEDGTVTCRTPTGRKVRSVRKLLSEVWGDILPEAMRRPVTTRAQAMKPVEDDEPEPAPLRRLKFSEMPHLRGMVDKIVPPQPIEHEVRVSPEDARKIIRAAAGDLG